jgi:hypothetical protein
MLGNSVVDLQATRGLRANEMSAGLEFARDKGWIEDAGNLAIRLTDSGFAEM